MKRADYPNLGETAYRTVLSGGLPVIVVPRPGFTRKIVYFATNFGGIHRQFTLDGRAVEAPGGIAHFLEHKLFDMPGGRDITAEFAALGAVPNAFTSHDMTAYFFSCTDHFRDCLKLLLEYVSTPYFTEESVAREQGIIGQEIGMEDDTPESRVFQNLMNSMYRTHPVRMDVLGTRQTIARITPQVLYDCHRAFYTPKNMLLCVVGDVDPQEVAALAEEMIPAGKTPQVTCVRRWQEEMTCPQPHIRDRMAVSMPLFQLGFKCEYPGEGTEAARQELIGDLAAEALFGEASPLYLKLYEQGLIDTSFGGGFETVEGMAMLTASGDSEYPEAVRDAILHRARQIAREGLEEEDFQRMKRSAMGRRIRDLDSFDSTCFRMCAYHFSGFDYFEFPGLFRQVSARDIREFITRVVTPERCALSVIHPTEKEDTYGSQ